MKLFTILAGIVMILGGGYGMLHPGATFLEMTWLLGGVLLLAGILGVIGFFGKRKEKDLDIWDFLSQIITICLGVFVLTKPGMSDVVIAYIFGGWLILTGALKLVGAFRLKKLGTKNWIWALVVGILDVLVGLYAAFHPFVSILAIGMIIGITFLMYGINLLALGIRFKKETP